MNQVQKKQDLQYDFPYHYIPKIENGNFTQTFNWSWGISYFSALEFILDKLKRLNFDSICDVGCGDGRLAIEIKKNYQNKNVFGVDYSENAIKLAKAMDRFNVEFISKNIISEELEQKFDVITLIEVFEHIPLEICEEFVSAMSNLLTKNGKILLTVPHKNKRLQSKHFQHFSKDSLIKYYEDKFNVQEVIFFEKRSKLNTLISFILTNRFFILNHVQLKNFLYKLYKKNCFFASESNCGRIFLMLSKK